MIVKESVPVLLLVEESVAVMTILLAPEVKEMLLIDQETACPDPNVGAPQEIPLLVQVIEAMPEESEAAPERAMVEAVVE